MVHTANMSSKALDVNINWGSQQSSVHHGFNMLEMCSSLGPLFSAHILLGLKHPSRARLKLFFCKLEKSDSIHVLQFSSWEINYEQKVIKIKFYKLSFLISGDMQFLIPRATPFINCQFCKPMHTSTNEIPRFNLSLITLSNKKTCLNKNLKSPAGMYP